MAEQLSGLRDLNDSALLVLLRDYSAALASRLPGRDTGGFPPLGVPSSFYYGKSAELDDLIRWLLEVPRGCTVWRDGEGCVALGTEKEIADAWLRELSGATGQPHVVAWHRDAVTGDSEPLIVAGTVNVWPKAATAGKPCSTIEELLAQPCYKPASHYAGHESGWAWWHRLARPSGSGGYGGGDVKLSWHDSPCNDGTDATDRSYWIGWECGAEPGFEMRYSEAAAVEFVRERLELLGTPLMLSPAVMGSEMRKGQGVCQ